MVGNILYHMAVCQNLVPLVNIKIAGKWMFIPLKMVLIGIDPYPYNPIYITCLFVQQIWGLQNVPPALRLRHPRVSQRAVRRCTEASISGAGHRRVEKLG